MLAPETGLDEPGAGEVEGHEREPDDQQPVGPCERATAGADSGHSLPDVSHASHGSERGKTDHGQMRVANDPVRKVDEAVEGHDGLHRALNADDEVDDEAGPDKAQRDVANDGALSGEADGEEELGDNDDAVDALINGCDFRGVLRAHG